MSCRIISAFRDQEEGRTGQICFVIGRTAFDEDASGCSPLLRYWGGEAIRGGPGEVPALATVGAPSIVVARLHLTRRHNDPYSRPELAKLFVGSLLGLDRRFGDVHYPDPVPGPRSERLRRDRRRLSLPRDWGTGRSWCDGANRRPVNRSPYGVRDVPRHVL